MWTTENRSRYDRSKLRYPGPAASEGRDRQEVGYRNVLCGSAQTLDREADHRLAQPLPTSGQGLGVPEPFGACIPALVVSSAHAEKALSRKQMTSDRL
jgi:hypothetical protein